MKDSISDVMIHINESIGVEARSSLEEGMRQIEASLPPGLTRAKINFS